MVCFCSVASAENVIRLHLFILLIKWCQDFDAPNMASSQACIVLSRTCTQLTQVRLCSICMQLLLFFGMCVLVWAFDRFVCLCQLEKPCLFIDHSVLAQPRCERVSSQDAGNGRDGVYHPHK